MMRNNADKSTIRKFIYGGLLFIMLLLITATLAFSQDDRKVETIDSTAMGTSTQMGSTIGVKVTIYQYSTDEDRHLLVDAFKKGQNQSLVDALS
jgi:hypothetical protein